MLNPTMLQLKKFVFNAFQVNTYILFDETRECVIIDAACSSPQEDQELLDFVLKNGLKPVHLLSTHSHIDHILGNAFAKSQFGLGLSAHKEGEMYLTTAHASAAMFGFRLAEVVFPDNYLTDNQWITFGNQQLQVLFTPGHAEGSVCFYLPENEIVITGDVLFYQSIGRTDLPGGNYDILKNSIWGKLFTLPEATLVYPGHGPETTIGSEKTDNPFVAIG